MTARVNPQIWATERLPSVTPALLHYCIIAAFDSFYSLPPSVARDHPPCFSTSKQKCVFSGRVDDGGRVRVRVLGEEQMAKTGARKPGLGTECVGALSFSVNLMTRQTVIGGLCHWGVSVRPQDLPRGQLYYSKS